MIKIEVKDDGIGIMKQD